MNDKSPFIEKISWGAVLVEGFETPFKDVKLFPGGAREWDWRETGTRHSPGVQTADVQELLDHGARVVVLSKGYQQRLQVKSETLKMLEEQGVETLVLETGEAAEQYNELAGEKAVGALIHSTC